jgi:hypothetical protein
MKNLRVCEEEERKVRRDALVRMKDIARNIGLSTVTISKVLRGHSDISEKHHALPDGAVLLPAPPKQPPDWRVVRCDGSEGSSGSFSFRKRAAAEAKTLYAEPGSYWENGYFESVIAQLWDEFQNGETICSTKGVRVFADLWRVHCT